VGVPRPLSLLITSLRGGGHYKKSRRCHLEEVYEEEHVSLGVSEPVREVIASPDEEILEDHDIV
jgi:hypothetical protein